MGNSSLTSTHVIPNGRVLLIIGIVFVAFNLRSPITSVGPLIGSIRMDTGISNGLAGLLTTLPLLTFALLAPLVPKLGQRFGHELSVLIGLSILSIGILLRSTGIMFTLFVGTALIGLGIAIFNVLLPGIVKHKFPKRIGLMTGIYSTSMGIWASLASGISVPLAVSLDLGWQKSLAVWAILSGMALLIWLPQLRNQDPSLKVPQINPASTSLWRSPLAWQVTTFMGLQSFLYFCMIAWLPEILYSNGVNAASAGWMLSLMQFAGLPSTFLIPVLADRLSNQRGIVVGIGALFLVGLSGLTFGDNMTLLTLCIILMGIASGASISLSLTIIGLRAANAKQAANLSGMAQSVGYFLASIGPFIIGFLFDYFHSWTPPLIMCFVICIVMIMAGLGAGRNQFVLPPDGK